MLFWRNEEDTDTRQRRASLHYTHCGKKSGMSFILYSIMVSTLACHAGDLGSIPSRGVNGSQSNGLDVISSFRERGRFESPTPYFFFNSY